MYYIDAVIRVQADPVRSMQSLIKYIKTKFDGALGADIDATRWSRLVKDHAERTASIGLQARELQDGSISPAFLMSQLRATCPLDTVWVVEAVTNAVVAADQVQPTMPGSWVNCGGGGLGWSGGGALGVKLAL